jgi:hypothetical protein
MRALGLSAVIFAGVIIVSPNGPAFAQAGGQSPSRSSCGSAAAPENRPPTLSLTAVPTRIGDTAAQAFALTATATDPNGDELSYAYSVTGGRITGRGATVVWDLRGVQRGAHTVNVSVDDAKGCSTSRSLSVSVDGW